jgi:LysM repeat protein
MSRRTPARTPARFLAPLALVAFAIACLVVVTSTGSGGNGGSATRPGAASKNATGGRRTSTTRTTSTKTPRTYVVRQGDNLSIIAERTGVSLARLRELNPTVDPQGLALGARLKLRP